MMMGTTPGTRAGTRATTTTLLCALALPIAVTVDASAADSPRSAKAILQDYARAVGGQAAWKKHRTMHLQREVSVKGMQIQGTEERWATAAGKCLNVISVPGIATFRQGTNGKVHWAEDPINGLRLLKGAEAEEARIESTWDAELNLAGMYDVVKLAEAPEKPPEGKRWECVELVPKVAKPAITCFDAETHLRVLQKGVDATPQGDVPYLTRFDDWREVAGVRIPHRQQMQAGPVTLDARITAVAFDVKLAPKLFEVPRAGSGSPAAGAKPR